jgi:DNA invertase Pin-like site-specific DNA recombinase
MKKALIYARVSTDEQAQEGMSIDTQINRCTRWAEENGYAIVGVYKDEGKSATNMNRASLKDLLGRVQEREGLDAILVLDTDRIARNTLDHLTIKSLLQKANVPLISISQPMIDDSPEGNLIDTIIASVNAFQSQITGRKVSKVAEEKAKAGYYPGKPKIGYVNVINPKPAGKFDKRTIDIDPERGQYITKAFTLYSTGNFSLKSLSDHLFELGFRSNTGGQAGVSPLAYFLRDPLYLGKIPWKGVIYNGHHPALTDEETFNKCQEIMTAHNQNASRQRVHNYLLRGFVYCYDCGKRLWADKHTKKSGLVFELYFCKVCSKGSYVDVNDLEEQVEEWFGAIQITKAYARDLVERAKQILEDFRSNSDNETQTITIRRSKIEAAMREAEDNWLIKKTLSAEAFRRIYDRYEADLKGIKKQMAQMVDNHNQSLQTVERLMALAQNIKLAYRDADPSLKRFYLGLFWQKFLVRKGKIVDGILTDEVKDLIKKPEEPSVPKKSTSNFLYRELFLWISSDFVKPLI